MKYRLFFLFVFCLSIPELSSAEYRVFVLKISKKAAPAKESAPAPAPTPTSLDFRLVESTLDPEQYRYYHTVAADEEITYIDTWRCYGRTDNFRSLCPNPKGQNSTAQNP